MEQFINQCIALGTQVGGRILFALATLVIGLLIIKGIKKALRKITLMKKLDPTVQSVIRNIIVALLYVVLAVAIFEILGVPMTSVVAVLASCGLAVGLALQGALANFAGGIMILIFKPFRVGDFVEASGAKGTVRDISLFYTSIITLDNKRILTNFSSEALRRVDIDFKISNDCDAELTKQVLLTAAQGTKGVLADPAPFARMTAVDDDTYIFTVRGWCENAEYWNVYADLIEGCSKALADNGIDDPEERIAVRLVKDEK